MDIVRESKAEWQGDLMTGSGSLQLGSKAYEGPYSFKGRTSAESKQTNPEELIAAAHAGCFTMQLSALLTKAKHPPQKIHSSAKVHLSANPEGISITGIDLVTEATVPGITKEEFLDYANQSKKICPVSKALAAVPITLQATLKE